LFFQEIPWNFPRKVIFWKKVRKIGPLWNIVVDLLTKYTSKKLHMAFSSLKVALFLLHRFTYSTSALLLTNSRTHEEEKQVNPKFWRQIFLPEVISRLEHSSSWKTRHGMVQICIPMNNCMVARYSGIPEASSEDVLSACHWVTLWECHLLAICSQLASLFGCIQKQVLKAECYPLVIRWHSQRVTLWRADNTSSELGSGQLVYKMRALITMFRHDEISLF
jgi:hypothetical protein